MADPLTMDEYNAKFAQNQRISGMGLDTTQHFPCPFCAAPDWAEIKVINAPEEFAKNRQCGECGRSARMVTVKDGGSISVDMVQTGGLPPPPFMGFIKRVDE